MLFLIIVCVLRIVLVVFVLVRDDVERICQGTPVFRALDYDVQLRNEIVHG